MRLSDLAHKHVVIWGGGVEGLAAAHAAQQANASSVSMAMDDKTEQQPAIDGIDCLVNEAAVKALLAADVVIKSPGIPVKHPLYQRLLHEQVIITTSTQLWFADHADQTIGITGTKGKSTTASLLGHLMGALGFDVALGGNVGVPLLSLPHGKQWYVAELSSYQCYDLTQSPHIAVFTSLFPEHLNWHDTVDAYYAAKLNLAAHDPAAVIANGENDELRQRLPEVAADAIRWIPDAEIAVSGSGVSLGGQPYITASDTQLLGRHNLLNIALCFGVLEQLGVDLVSRNDTIRAALHSFQPLPHRLQSVAEKRGLCWINDSLSTTPQSAIAALEIFKDEPGVSIIVGGNDRGISYEPLHDYFAKRTNPVQIFTIPDSGEHIARVIGDVPPHRVYACDSLQQAVEQAAQKTPTNGVVLLSPAAPSFGRFKDYKDRGEQFTNFVKNL